MQDFQRLIVGAYWNFLLSGQGCTVKGLSSGTSFREFRQIDKCQRDPTLMARPCYDPTNMAIL